MNSSSGWDSARSGQDCAEPVVYVIDDDESMRFALRNLFRSVRLRVETFETAGDFLAFPKYAGNRLCAGRAIHAALSQLVEGNGKGTDLYQRLYTYTQDI